MPRMNFSQIEDAEDRPPLPDGEYTCCLDNIEEATTRNGDDMWKLRFVVTEGDHKERRVFDNLVFSESALPRVKHICASLGLDVSGDMDLNPEDIMGRRCRIEVLTKQYLDKNGETKTGNYVPFTGYRPVEESTVGMVGVN